MAVLLTSWLARHQFVHVSLKMTGFFVTKHHLSVKEADCRLPWKLHFRAQHLPAVSSPFRQFPPLKIMAQWSTEKMRYWSILMMLCSRWYCRFEKRLSTEAESQRTPVDEILLALKAARSENEAAAAPS